MNTLAQFTTPDTEASQRAFDDFARKTDIANIHYDSKMSSFGDPESSVLGRVALEHPQDAVMAVNFRMFKYGSEVRESTIAMAEAQMRLNRRSQ